MKTNIVYQGNCKEQLRLLPDNSIQCVVTSPPYWGLRDYDVSPQPYGDGTVGCNHTWETIITKPKGGRGDASIVGANRNNEANMRDAPRESLVCSTCGMWLGQLGLEPTPEQYVENIVSIFSEIKRTLKEDGTIWLNLGDTYYSKGGASRHKGFSDPKYPNGRNGTFNEPQTGQHDFLKPKDLVGIPWRVAFALQEKLGLYLRQAIIWHKPNAMPSSVKDRPSTDYEFIFLFSKSETYYYDAQSIREPYTKPMNRWGGTETKSNGDSTWDNETGQSTYRKRNLRPDPMGRNCRAVWSINTCPYPEAHFAVYPEELPRRCIKAGSREGDIILDPFAGSGTTLKVAKQLNRKYIGIELSEKYISLINDRLEKTNCMLQRWLDCAK